MIAVDQWTGEMGLLLQSVMRLSIRDFARRLGISSRTVSNWHTNPALVCVPVTAQILDSALAQCLPDEQEAFRVRLAEARGNVQLPGQAAPAPCSVISHKFLPVYVGPPIGQLLTAGASCTPGPAGLDRSILTTEHHSAEAASVHLYACGVAVVHLEQHQRVDTLTELALWRYQSYPNDRAWVGRELERLLEGGSAHREEGTGTSPHPQYVLSVYELREHTWTGQALETAIQLLTTPSVLVDRQSPDNVVPLGSGVEHAKFATGWAHPEAVSFGGGVSLGLAGWSGVAYHPRADERALTMGEIIALELDTQALWALSSHILAVVEDGKDPVMPKAYGWRYLRGACSRLTAARPTETAQHRAMRESILATSELPDRLRAAQEALRDGSP